MRPCPSRTFRRLLLVPVLLCAALQSAELPRPKVFHPLGSKVARPETLQALEQLAAGEVNMGIAALKTIASTSPDEFAAWHALSEHAVAENDFQQGLELLCKATAAAGSSPWSEVYAEELSGLLPFCRSPQPFLDLVSRAERSADFPPRLKDQLKTIHADWLLSRGEYSAAGEVCKSLRNLTRWAITGPIDNRDGAGFSQSFEPESFIDFEKSVPGRNRRVGWHRPAAVPLDGRIDLADLFEPSIHVLAYAVTFVKADADTWAVLRVGCAGGLNVWVNGVAAGSVTQHNDYAHDKLTAPVFLRKGWNQILVKTGIVEETEWSFSARLCQPAGGPLEGITIDDSAAALSGYQADTKARTAAPPEVPGTLDRGILFAIEKALKNEPDNLALLVAQGSLIESRKLAPKEELSAPTPLARAATLAPKCPYIKLKIATLSRDTNEARQAAESVLASHDSLPGVFAVLATLAQESHNHVIASDYARQLKSRFGAEKLGVAAFALAGVNPEASKPAQRGTGEGAAPVLRALSIKTLQAFTDNHPYLADGWHRLLDLETTVSARRSILQKALSYCGGDREMRQRWIDELNEMGKYEQAAEFLAAEAAAQPFDLGLVIHTAHQYRRAGNAARAAQVLEAALTVAPESAELLAELARARHAAGQTADAVKLYRQVLQIKPNSPQIKDYLSILDTDPASEKKFFAAYDIQLKDLPVPQASAYPEDNVVHLLNQQVVRVNTNGSSSRMIHRVSKLLRPNGIQQLAQHSIWYEPERQVVDILRAAVITPDGRELSRADVQDRSTSAAMGVQTRIYDEHHLKQVTFKNLEPGAIIDLQYTIRDTGDNIYGDYFADTFYLSDDDPVLKSQYVLDFPKDLNLQTKTMNTSAQAERIAQSDTRREVFKWQTENTPGIQQERGMPPVVDQLAQVQVTTMKSWQEVGQWYWHLAREQLVPSEEMRTAVLDMTRDCKTDTEKLRVIHDWVIRKIRYLGIEFGRNGYKPHRASDTFKSLYGDCKDTATLITSMLQIVNIPCNLVLIRTVDAGNIPPDSLPMPNLFNHCIAHVPAVDGREYWIDCTTDFHRLGEVPDADQTAQVLAVNSAGGKFLKVPGSEAKDNVIQQQFTVKVERSGAATVQIQDYRHGQFAPAYRQLAESPGQYERYMKDYAARRFNGAEVEKLEFAPPHEQGAMWMKTSLKVSALATQSGERKTLPATLDGFFLSPRFAAQTKRRHDLELHYPWMRKMEIVYQLEAGLKVVSVPEDVEIVEPFGRYSRKIKHAEGGLTIQENFELSRQRIAVAEYEAFRLFCNRVDSLLDQKVLLEAK
ncbi:MAG TPA: DUF3857 domain-containing protein [Planctomycetota bacterium]|nr:DUF3857 domain-containing protein [Planctomycetota bacterium]